MPNEITSTFDEKQKMTDLLTTEKQLASAYNTFCSEAATATVRSCLCSLLSDEHRIGEALFAEMNSRSWYTVESAPEAKIQSTKQQFSNSVSK